MRKLLLLTLDFPPRTGGVARYLDALANQFRDHIQVVAQPERGSAAADQLAPYPIKRVRLLNQWANPKWMGAVWFLVARLQKNEIVLVSHVLPLGTAAWFAKFFTRQPYIVVVHGMDIGLAKQHPWKRRLARRVLRGAECVVANSRALAAEVERDFGVMNTTVVYPCLSDRDLASFEANRDDAAMNLLTVSRLVPRKGHERVLEALSRLRDRGQLGSIAYDIVGDGPMKEAIQDKIRMLGLERIVRLRGEVTDHERDQCYARASAFIMPTVVSATDREGFGTVYLEAAARGVPSIATRQPGVDEAVLDDETGLLVPDGDIDALAGVIHRLATEPRLLRQLGDNARRRALAEFTRDAQFGKLRAIL